MEVFALPTGDRWLIYAPLHDVAALVNESAVEALRRGEAAGGCDEFARLSRLLAAAPARAPQARSGAFIPEFLGLILTRRCNMSCRYCGFGAAAAGAGSMPAALAGRCIEWYAELLRECGWDRLRIHFFGGEPLYEPPLFKQVIRSALELAEEYYLHPSFEVSTNGFSDRETAEFLARHVDDIVLSLDGPREIHDQNRLLRDGSSGFETIFTNALLMNEGPGRLHLRACVTSQTVGMMEETARWFARHFHPASVCFETVQPCAGAGTDLLPPDPWEFAGQFIRARALLKQEGITAVYASADISAFRTSFCPVGSDAIIVSPDGCAAGCYLLPSDWEAKGMDLRLGRFDADGLRNLPGRAVERIRAYNVLHYQRCEDCFCRWHCSGGCHVNHSYPGCPQTHDDFCLQTRMITLISILEGLDTPDWTPAEGHLWEAALQTKDRISVASPWFQCSRPRND